MILVIGAEASGKRAYVRSLGYMEGEIADAMLDERPVLDQLHTLVFADPAGSTALLEELLLKQVVICNEVGSGVIPLSRQDREAREATGRLCCRLAKHAERVVRLVAGIPIVIKGA